MLTEKFLQTRSTGKIRRLRRLFNYVSRRSLIVPVDDSLIAGPVDGLQNLEAKLRQIVVSRPNGILAFPGAATVPEFRETTIPLILNLTTSTRLSNHTQKRLSFSIEHAIRLGADAVAVHVNLTSAYEPAMLESLGFVVMAAEELGIPVMGIMYPRREGEGQDDNYEQLKNSNPHAYTKLVAHACRVGMELGVDIVKTQYTGSLESFQTVIAAAEGVPVLIAGGPIVSESVALQRAVDVIGAGGSGVSYGRNVFSRTNVPEFLAALNDVVHNDISAETAISRIHSTAS